MKKWLLTNLITIVTFGIGSLYLLELDFSDTPLGQDAGRICLAFVLICLFGMLAQFQIAWGFYVFGKFEEKVIRHLPRAQREAEAKKRASKKVKWL